MVVPAPGAGNAGTRLVCVRLQCFKGARQNGTYLLSFSRREKGPRRYDCALFAVLLSKAIV